MDPNPKTLLVKVAKLLDDLSIPYVLTGGLAVTIWGQPRTTQDADLIAEVQLRDVPKLFAGLQGLSGAGYIDDLMMREAIEHNGEFNYIDPESGYKIDFWVPKESPFTRACFDRRVHVEMDGYPIWVVTPEDLIVSKLDWWRRGSAKSQYDIRWVMDAQGTRLDWQYIEHWSKLLGLDEQLQIAKAFHEHPPI